MAAFGRAAFARQAKASALEPTEADVLFSDFMLNWLELIRSSVEETTFESYRRAVKTQIVPFFKETGLTLATQAHSGVLHLYDGGEKGWRNHCTAASR